MVFDNSATWYTVTAVAEADDDARKPVTPADSVVGTLRSLTQTLIPAPIVLYVAGFVVHNSYLARFGLSDFEPISARYILGGTMFVCCVWAAALGVVLYPQSRVERPRHRLAVACTQTIGIGGVLAWMVGAFPDRRGASDFRLDESLVAAFPFVAIFITFIAAIGASMLQEDASDVSADKFFESVLGFGLIPCLPLAVYVSSCVPAVRDVYVFVITVASATVSARGGLSRSRRILSRRASGDVSVPPTPSVWATVGTAPLLIGLSFLGVVATYSANVYPKMAVAWGGGRALPITVVTSTDRVVGDLVNQTSAWIAIRLQDGTVVQVPLSTALRVTTSSAAYRR